jgi:NACalpha-BTF3-like transcription factor
MRFTLVPPGSVGGKTRQIIGEPEERALSSEPEISEDDIKTVMEQAKVDKKTALAAIKKHKGDLAEAIIELRH